MVKAHSLLYAIYICLIVALLCGALLYIANLYNQLNIVYVSREQLYIHNQSLVNYSLANMDNSEDNSEDMMTDEETGIESVIETKNHGMYKLLLVKSIRKNDTVTSVHFVGQPSTDKTCIYLPGFGRSLSYSGKVKLIGNKYLPGNLIEPVFINNEPNILESTGAFINSERFLPEIKNMPEINADTENILEFGQIERINDSVYFNSFLKPSVNVSLHTGSLDKMTVKGNFIFYSKDSIQIKQNAVLEDVIIIAPKITIEDNFKGNIQAIATKGITIGANVTLYYPSALILKNSTDAKTNICINEHSTIQGDILMYGEGNYYQIDNNILELKEHTQVTGNIYCGGTLIIKGNVYGSVYTNKILHTTPSGKYENCISNIEINVNKRPEYYISTPMFNGKQNSYGLVKKVN